MHFTPVKSFTIVATLLVPLCADAQDADRISAAANALGINQDALVDCLPANATPGQRLPQSARGKVLQCLKTANPELTNARIRSAMQDLRG